MSWFTRDRSTKAIDSWFIAVYYNSDDSLRRYVVQSSPHCSVCGDVIDGPMPRDEIETRLKFWERVNPSSRPVVFNEEVSNG